MKKNIQTAGADELLQSIGQINEADAGTYFYTRLKARMEREKGEKISVALKPAWAIGLLIFLLFINSFLLIQQTNEKPVPGNNSGLQNFAKGYDLTLSNSF